VSVRRRRKRWSCRRSRSWLQWLVEAADQLRAFSQYFLHDLRVTQVQLDELYALLRALKDGAITEAEAIERLSRSSHWVWTAMAPTSKLLLTIDLGARTLAMTQRVVHQVVQVLAPDCVPLFLTDGFKEYATALLTHYGHWRQRPRRQDKEPHPKPRWLPLPHLLYAQVIKTTRRWRLVSVTHRVVFGTVAAVTQVLEPYGWQINTAFVERLNLDIRQRVAAVGVESTRCARARTACASNWWCFRPTTISCCPMPAYGSPCRCLSRPMAVAPPSSGGRVRQRWRLG
jgi:IS1 family transposase